MQTIGKKPRMCQSAPFHRIDPYKQNLPVNQAYGTSILDNVYTNSGMNYGSAAATNTYVENYTPMYSSYNGRRCKNAL